MAVIPATPILPSITCSTGRDEELGIWTWYGRPVAQVDWQEGDSGRGMSYARVPDLTGPFRTVADPTPGAPNAGAPWAPAAIVVALFAVLGIAVVDDFGVSTDEFTQREIAQINIDYALGTGGLPTYASDRYYGVAFEAPLILVERLLGLTDSRAILLSRHLLTHLFFLAGGWFCYLLTCRLFGHR